MELGIRDSGGLEPLYNSAHDSMKAHGADFQPIFEVVDNAKELQNSIKSKATMAVDHAIGQLQEDRKNIRKISELKPMLKTIDKEIKNLQSLKKQIRNAKIETGEQALQLSENVKSRINDASSKTGDKKVALSTSLNLLSQMADNFNSKVTEAGQKLNDVVSKEMSNIPEQHLTFKDKIDKIIKKLLNLVVKDPAHTGLSQVEKRANNLEKLCKQKDATILADLKKGMPIEEANRNAVGKIKQDMEDFKKFLKGSHDHLHATYSLQRDDAIERLKKHKEETRDLGKMATIVARITSVLENLGESSIEKQDDALKKLMKKTSIHLKHITRELKNIDDEELGLDKAERARQQSLQKLVTMLQTQTQHIKNLQEALKDVTDPGKRLKLINATQRDTSLLSKQIERARAYLIGDADKKLKDAQSSLRALKVCIDEEWPKLPEPNYRDSKEVDAYVKEMKSRFERGYAFFFKQRT